MNIRFHLAIGEGYSNMDIQVIIIVGDRTVSDGGDVEWENVHKNQHLFTYTTPIHTLVSAKFKAAAAFAVTKMAHQLVKTLIKEYLTRLTKSSAPS